MHGYLQPFKGDVVHRTWPRWFVALGILIFAIFGATGARAATVTLEARSAPPAYVFAPSTKTIDRKSTRLNSSHGMSSRMPSSA